MGGLFWIVVPSKVDPRKANPKIVALTGVCVVVLMCQPNWEHLPRLGGGFQMSRMMGMLWFPYGSGLYVYVCKW
jgi:hypothetical protein